MAIEAEELATISRSIRSAGQETAGEFRQAANASNANLARIVKDISTTFKAQREDIADLRNVLEEMVSESQQTGNKIDSLNSLFRESLEIQNAMATQLSNVTRNTKNLSGDIESLNRNIMNSSSGGLLGSITGIGKNVADSLLAAGIGAIVGGAAGYVAGGGLGAGGGGGGESNVPQSTGAGGKFNASQAAALIRKVGGNEEEATILGAISQPESGGNPGIRNNNPRTGDDSYGLWQINMLGKMGPERLKKFGLSDPNQLRDPETNARVALQMLREAHGVPRDWTTWKHGKHLKYMEAARAGASGKTVASAKAENSSSQTRQSTTPSSATPQASTTPSAAPSAQETVPSATAERVERIGKEGGHGPISGAAHEGHAEKTEGSAALPAGDIVALGHALEKMGMRISEHPSFGTVHHVHKGSAHYEGRAIDINFGKGNIEASDPVLGAKFDNLAAQLTKLGYKVYWRESGPYGAKGHNNHLHAEIPKGGATPTPDTYQIPGTPEQRAMQGATPLQDAPSNQPIQIPSIPQPQTTPIPQQPTVQSAPQPQITPMAAMIPGMMGGGIGGITGMLLPMIASAIQSQIVATPSMPALNTQMVNQAAIASQATEQTVQEAQTSFFNPTVNAEPNRMHSADTSGFAYNMPGDIGWPDWAGMLGGNHWEEMKNYKKNMWG